jgi:hypothetical protein
VASNPGELMSFAKVTGGDPKRPDEARKFNRDEVNTDDRSDDLMLLLTMVAGMLALLLRLKVLAWISAITSVSAIADSSQHSTDRKTLTTTITFAIMGLIASYFLPQKLAASK